MSAPASEVSSERASLGSCVVLVLLTCALLAMAPALARPWQGAGPVEAWAWAALGAGALALLGLVWVGRRVLLVSLSSLTFAVVLLSALLLATVLGTLVVQGAPPEQYVATHGGGGARVVALLGLDDVFHTPWFAGLLGLMALGLVLALVRRQAWRPAEWGHLLAHGGVVVVLVGGAITNQLGLRGRLELAEGATAHALVPDGEEQPVPLGFGLRLDGFSLEYHDDPWRVFHYLSVEGGGWVVGGAWTPQDLGAWTGLPEDGGAFRVVATVPHIDAAAQAWVAGASAPADAGSDAATTPASGSDAAARSEASTESAPHPALAPLPIGADAPGVLVELRGPDGAVTRALLGEGPLHLARGGLLVLDERGDAIRQFVSQLSLLDEGGALVTRHELRVNQPLSAGGFRVYQSAWRPGDLAYSGLLLVRDPGLPVVTAGYLATLAGVAWLLLGARLVRREPAP